MRITVTADDELLLDIEINNYQTKEELNDYIKNFLDGKEITLRMEPIVTQ